MIGERPPEKPPAKPSPEPPEPVSRKPRKPRARVSLQRKADSVRDCVYCKETIGEQGHAWCLRCKTVLHKDCADELGDCPSLGCGGELMRYTPKILAPPRQRPIHLIPALANLAFHILTVLLILGVGYFLAAIFTLPPAVLLVLFALWLMADSLTNASRAAWDTAKAKMLSIPRLSPRAKAFGRSALRVGLAVGAIVALYLLALTLSGGAPGLLMAGLDPR